MEVTGNITQIFEEQVISEKFKKREFVITTNEQYPQEIIIQLTQDRCRLIEDSDVMLNDFVKVSINLRGRQYTNANNETKWFNSIDAWKIENLNKPKQETTQETFSPTQEDDLPF